MPRKTVSQATIRCLNPACQRDFRVEPRRLGIAKYCCMKCFHATVYPPSKVEIRGEVAIIHIQNKKGTKFEAILDKTDLPSVLNFSPCWYALVEPHTTYVVSCTRNKPSRVARRTWLHRLLMGVDDKRGVDHVNRNGLDNRRCNLRLATNSENQANGLSPKGASHFKGVYPSGRKWRGVIRVHNKSLHLGMFANPPEAAMAYDIAARHYFGEFARLNFPTDQGEIVAPDGA